jgi:predicted nucleic acid-binding protein
VGEIINLLREDAELVTIRSEGDSSPDPDDNAFRACAEQGRAAFIATLNKKHFPQKNLTAKVTPSTLRRYSAFSRSACI